MATTQRLSTVTLRSLLVAVAFALIAASCASSSGGEVAANDSTASTTSSAEPPTTAELTSKDDDDHDSEVDGEVDEVEMPVTQAAVLFPIGPGEVDDWQDALADLIGPRYNEYAESRARFGLTQQTTMLQQTPMGNFALIYMEGPDLAQTTELMASSSEEWDIDWRVMTSDLHDVDFDDPNAISIAVELVADTGDLTEAEKSGTTSFIFFIPLNADKVEDLQTDFAEMLTTQGDDYRAARHAIGVAEEKVFLQNTVVGPGLVVYWEAENPAASLQQLLDSTDPFDLAFTNQLDENHAVPVAVLSEIWADNILVADFPSRS